MTVEEFLAFTETRPDEECWELIEGIAVLQHSPSKAHQMIATNVVAGLRLERRRQGALWVPLLGVGTIVPVSPRSLPQPDVFVLENPDLGEAAYENTTRDGLVLFEVLSRSNGPKDQAWRRRVYASIPNCQHYVTVHQRRIEVVRYDRSSAWQATRLTKAAATLSLPALGAELPLTEIYADTPLGKA
jgi:Uma2 family endonuclease